MVQLILGMIRKMHKNLIVLTLQPKYEFTKIDYIIQSDPSAYNTQADISSC